MDTMVHHLATTSAPDHQNIPNVMEVNTDDTNNSEHASDDLVVHTFLDAYPSNVNQMTSNDIPVTVTCQHTEV